MYSRRLVEILACGGIAVTSPAQSVDNLFKDYVHVVSTTEEAMTLFTRIAKEGPNVQDLERARSGAEYVLREHTWERRLAEIVDLVGVGCAR
jgi:spore maturation protein CgeB